MSPKVSPSVMGGGWISLRRNSSRLVWSSMCGSTTNGVVLSHAAILASKQSRWCFAHSSLASGSSREAVAFMAMEGEDRPEPTQETSTGATIPVPKREDVFRDLEKVARPKPRSTRRSRPEKDAAT